MTEKRKREQTDDWRWTEIARNRGEAHLGVMRGICVHAVEMHLNTLFYAAVLRVMEVLWGRQTLE